MKHKNLSLTAVFVEEPEGGILHLLKKYKGLTLRGKTLKKHGKI